CKRNWKRVRITGVARHRSAMVLRMNTLLASAIVCAQGFAPRFPQDKSFLHEALAAWRASALLPPRDEVGHGWHPGFPRPSDYPLLVPRRRCLGYKFTTSTERHLELSRFGRVLPGWR